MPREAAYSAARRRISAASSTETSRSVLYSRLTAFSLTMPVSLPASSR